MPEYLTTRNLLSADRPLHDPTLDEDILGFAQFAKHLAESIATMAPPEGLVLAIYGSWGSGKTTVLEFIDHYLKAKSQDQRPIPLPFNPWWFSGQEDLTRQFFHDFEAKLKIVDKSAELRDNVSKLGKAYGETGLFGAGVVKGAVKLIERTPVDVAELKKKISDSLLEKGVRIVVTIDDIDRLTAEEIRNIFRLVKGVADFPNVVYLLSFDKEVVKQALTGVQGGDGDAYLEKIVQVPFDLPIPREGSLQKLLWQRIRPTFFPRTTLDPKFEQSRFQQLYRHSLGRFIKTPRDVVRLANVLSVTYPAVRGDVNPVDFIAIEALRVFHPWAYNVVRTCPEEFLGPPPREESEETTFRNVHDKWMTSRSSVSDRDKIGVKMLLVHLFPKLNRIWPEARFRSDDDANERAGGRISAREVFSIYFRLALSDDYVSRVAIAEGLEQAESKDSFENWLLEMRRTTPQSIAQILERLEDFAESSLPPERAINIVQALLNIGDQLPHTNVTTPWTERHEATDTICRIIYRLMGQMNKSVRHTILERGIADGNSWCISAFFVARLGGEHGKFGREGDFDHEQLVDAHGLAILEAVSLQKIRTHLDVRLLPSHFVLWWLLAYWREWSQSKEPMVWLHDQCQDIRKVPYVLTGFLQVKDDQEDLLGSGGITYRLDPSLVEQYINPWYLMSRVKRLTSSAIRTDIQHIAVQEFLLEYRQIEQGRSVRTFWGQNPSPDELR